LEHQLGMDLLLHQALEIEIFYSEISDARTTPIQNWSDTNKRFVVLNGVLTNNNWPQEEMITNSSFGVLIL
jgi:hypothetical protein